MNSNGIAVTVIWFATILILLVAAKWIKPFLKKNMFWYIAMPIWIGLFLWLKVYATIDYSLDQASGGRPLEDTLFYPIIFLTDFCPFGGLIPPLLAIFPKTRKYAAYFALWMIITAHITLFEIAMDAPDPSVQNLAEYIFVGGRYGDHVSYFYFMSHYIMMVIAFLLLIQVNKKEVNWGWMVRNVFFMGVYLAYVMVVKYLLLAGGVNLDHNLTGMAAYDWNGGQYTMAADVLGIHNFPGVMIVGFTIVTAVDIAFFWLYYVVKHFDQFKLFTIKK